MQDYYSARATQYDEIYHKPERQADLRQLESWLADKFSARSVLEMACGTGYWTPFYAPHATRVLGIDAAPETLAIARQRMPLAKFPQVELQIGDAYRPPKHDATNQAFDGAFAGFWWSHIPLERIPTFLKNFHAVLSPGTRVVFIDNRYVPGSSTAISERDSTGNTYQQRVLADGSTHRILKNFPERDALLQAVAPWAHTSQHHVCTYYWALEYELHR